MLQILTIGLMLLMMFSCNIPNVKDPVESCHINTDKMISNCGMRNLNIKSERETIGEWVRKPTLYGLDKAHNMVCFGLEDWLKRMKPTLKESHDLWVDHDDKKN